MDPFTRKGSNPAVPNVFLSASQRFALRQPVPKRLPSNGNRTCRWASLDRGQNGDRPVLDTLERPSPVFRREYIRFSPVNLTRLNNRATRRQVCSGT